MKVTAFIFGVAATLATSAPANADCTSQTIGQFTYTNCDNGGSYTTQHIGNFSYTNGTDGNGNYRSGQSQQVGNYTYHSGDLYESRNSGSRNSDSGVTSLYPQPPRY
jgi:hypothetical protein